MPAEKNAGFDAWWYVWLLRFALQVIDFNVAYLISTNGPQVALHRVDATNPMLGDSHGRQVRHL